MGTPTREAQQAQGRNPLGQEESSAERPRTIKDVAAQWETVLRDFQDVEMPYKIETNAAGWVVMEPPPADVHRLFQTRLSQFLDDALDGGTATIEIGLHTHGGTKIPDVVWASYETWEKRQEDLATAPPPRVCVEVLSPSNTDAEIEEKRRLYLDIGVEEVWICEQDGTLRFYDDSGGLQTSKIVEGAPNQISGEIRG